MAFQDRTYLMGILNVTPDSFSDGGLFFDHEKAVDHGLELAAEGADIIDVGGESTRPGSFPVSLEEEIRRVIPVIRALSRQLKIPVAIDSYKAKVARMAVDAGASIINDISALRLDPEMVNVVRENRSSVVLMHMKGLPRTMQINPEYRDVVKDIHDFLSERIHFAEENGIRHDDIIIDPGIGFGKRLRHNLSLMKHLDVFSQLKCPVLVGPSRKSFIGEVLELPVTSRDEGTAALVAVAILKGANIIRVHDIRMMKNIIRMTDAVQAADNEQ